MFEPHCVEVETLAQFIIHAKQQRSRTEPDQIVERWSLLGEVLNNIGKNGVIWRRDKKSKDAVIEGGR